MSSSNDERFAVEAALIIVSLLVAVVVVIGVELIRSVWINPIIQNWIKLAIYIFAVTWIYLRINLDMVNLEWLDDTDE